MKAEVEHTQGQRNKKGGKKQVDGVEVPMKSGEGTMMEQSPEMIGGSGRQMHLMRSFVSRHNHFSDFLYFLFFCIFCIYI